jgi:NADPH:quinone reductase-like Zn-dependent oxidoreductase
MLRAVTVNKLKPVLDRVFGLGRVRAAMERMEADKQFGKIAIKIG